MSDSAKRVERRSKRTILTAYLESARRKGGGAIAATDGDGKDFKFNDISRGAFALGAAIARHTEKNENVGILLPTGVGAIITLLALHTRGRVPAMLNFTSGARNLLAACETARISKIITAHRFIDIAKIEPLIEELKKSLDVIYLEDIRTEIKPVDKALAIAGPLLPQAFAARRHWNDPGVILFHVRHGRRA